MSYIEPFIEIHTFKHKFELKHSKGGEQKWRNWYVEWCKGSPYIGMRGHPLVHTYVSTLTVKAWLGFLPPAIYFKSKTAHVFMGHARLN